MAKLRGFGNSKEQQLKRAREYGHQIDDKGNIIKEPTIEEYEEWKCKEVVDDAEL